MGGAASCHIMVGCPLQLPWLLLLLLLLSFLGLPLLLPLLLLLVLRPSLMLLSPPPPLHLLLVLLPLSLTPPSSPAAWNSGRLSRKQEGERQWRPSSNCPRPALSWATST